VKLVFLPVSGLAVNAIKVYIPLMPVVEGLEENDCGRYYSRARKAASPSRHWEQDINTSETHRMQA